MALITDEEIKQLSDTMIAMVEEHGMKFFLRDADNILSAECVVLIGTREQTQGLNCGHCGFATCAGRTDGVPCALNSIDVGIAIGSAKSVREIMILFSVVSGVSLLILLMSLSVIWNCIIRMYFLLSLSWSGFM